MKSFLIHTALLLALLAPQAAHSAELTEAGAEVAARTSEARYAALGDAHESLRDALIIRWNAVAVAEQAQGQGVPVKVWKAYNANLRKFELALAQRVKELQGGTAWR